MRLSPNGGSGRAYLLNHLGKNYRLSYDLNVELRNWDEADRCRRRAITVFKQATDALPKLIYPWSHLLDMYEQNLLRRPTAKGHLKRIVQQLDEMAAHDEAMHATRDRVRARHDKTWLDCQS